MTQPPQQPMQYQMQPVTPGNGLGIASLVLGIIALCLFCVPILPWLLAIVAIVLGIVSIVQASGAPTGKAKAGMLLGVIALFLGIGFWALFGLGAHKAGTQLQQQIDKAQKDNPEFQQQMQDLHKKLNDAVQKQQQEQMPKSNDQSTPGQPGSMLSHPHGRRIHLA